MVTTTQLSLPGAHGKGRADFSTDCPTTMMIPRLQPRFTSVQMFNKPKDLFADAGEMDENFQNVRSDSSVSSTT
jgi:hypothetical protein